MSRLVSVVAVAGVIALFTVESAMAHPVRNESAMEPGLWNMTISGTIHVPSANITEPMQKNVQICIKPKEATVTPFLPSGSAHCTVAHEPLANGHEQWDIHCTAPHAVIQQMGWIQSLPKSFASHWKMTEQITGPASYTTETIMDMKGNRVGPDCGSVR